MKRTSIFCLTMVLLTLGGCYHYDPTDRVEERAEKLAMKRAYQGCHFFDDHEAYRNCVIATLERNSPKTFTVAENSNGQPLAIIKSNVACGQNCPASQTTIKTEVTKTITTEPVKKVVIIKPAESTTSVPADTATSTVTKQVIEEQKTVQKSTQTKPTVTIKEVTVKDAPITETVVVQEQKEPTWWEKYQETKQPETVVSVKCPCEDPNDPCPQCVEK